jgi:PEGA domain
MKGKDITIPKGTEITAYVNGDIPLDQKRFAPLTADNPETAEAVSTVEIKSVPDGADITVDDKFVGNTPSSLRVAPGDHKIKLEKPGFKNWERVLTVSAGAISTVNPTLEKIPQPQ